MVIEIASKPGIRVKVEIEAGALKRVSLEPSKTFCLECSSKDSKILQPILEWLKAYAKGKAPIFPLPLSNPSSKNSFRDTVLRFLQAIPHGTVLTYKEVAEGVKNPRAARAVGNICRGNLFPLIIPCHRVIRADGQMGNYTPNPKIKFELLRFEGVK